MMTAAKLNPSLTRGSLLLGTPKQSSLLIDAPNSNEPISSVFLNVPANEIDYFDGNPRTAYQAEQYAQIKTSIQAVGIQQPVHITRRPDGNRYILAKGGNTRLKILRELYAETGDDKYRLMPCLYTAYTSESDLKIAHVIENEQRVEMSFWDKAQAYVAIRDLLSNGNSIGLRELETLFAEHGLSVSHSALSLFLFAAEHLQAIAERFSGSLSNQKAKDIRKLFQLLKEKFKSLNLREDCTVFWQQVLSDYARSQAEKSELDTDVLEAFVWAAFTQEYGAVTTEPVTTDNHSPTSDGSSVSRRTTTPPSVVEPQAVGNPRSSSANEIVSDHNALFSAENAIKELHKHIRAWLKEVNLLDCFKANSGFQYGFYLEYPNFHHLPEKANCPFLIDALHADAGNVFCLLAKISGQEAILEGLTKTAAAILSLPDDSMLKIAYQNEDKFIEYQDVGIGQREHLIDCVLHWQSTGHPFGKHLTQILFYLRILNQPPVA
ncbi:ParB N-terminal domain-containing protein [Stenoxybacter acetivorans]|uniref:ParB N-terminal domain-containing protein n=1 Tax=Stenoxybacter acetivorans TaxID=422441 RepID=UPI00055D5257|nr:ParB N-terminal domain-containing protein [Stenoxybacter acetivorans]